MFFAAVGALVTGFVGGWLLRMVKPGKVRRIAFLLWSLTPFVVWSGWSLVIGCFPGHAIGERCGGWGFGLVLMLPAMILWTTGACTAIVIGRAKYSN